MLEYFELLRWRRNIYNGQKVALKIAKNEFREYRVALNPSGNVVTLFVPGAGYLPFKKSQIYPLTKITNQ